MSKSKRIMKKAVAWMLICCIFFGLSPTREVQAKTATGTATLRILSTTDLHGQSVNVNYDSATTRSLGSLAQVSTLINNAKNSLKYGNTLLVDIGDTIYGFGSDSICNGAVTGVEYMYTEMATMGYDAMTVGNHDFDYGYSYLKKELQAAGLSSKVVVSNVYNAKTKKNVWAENKVITKKLTTTKGKTISVKIGLIGVTTPALTTHYDHSLLLTTKDMVESVKEQVEKLKKKSADLIIVLAHTGIGSLEYTPMTEQAAYEISKVDGVDAIVGGHAHVNFPSTDANVQKFYSYPGVSEDGLLNGTPYVAVKDHGAGIGMIDLKLKVVDGKVTVTGNNVTIKYVKSTTKPDESIVKINEKYQEQLDEIYSMSLGAINGRATNYFGPLEDNAAVQAANEAKIRYGMEYVNNTATDYRDCPVIAATKYTFSGGNLKTGFIDVDKDFKIADSLNVQNWNREFAFVYTITGHHLREWLEWQAGAYQNPAEAAASNWEDPVVKKYVEEDNMAPLLSKDWVDNWSGFLVFDGIEYEVDPTKSPRYDKAGTLIDKNAHRLTKLTCNGKEVTDSMEFVLVCPRVNSSFCAVPELVAEIPQRIIGNKRVYNNVLLQDYVKDQSQYAQLSIETDENWQIKYPEGTNYLIKSAKNSEDYAIAKDWYVQTLETTSDYAYFQAQKADVEDHAGPFLALACGNTKTTNHEIPVVVQASDSSGIRSIKYYNGILPMDSQLWNGASFVQNNSFLVGANGVYSVRAEDNNGNYSVRYIYIGNYNGDVLEIPVVTKCTNRAKQILGTAEPGTTLYAQAEGKTYSAQVQEDGSFAVDAAYLPADTVVKLWIENESGRKSPEISYAVKRTGANIPEVDEITNKSQAITGVLNDSKYCKVVAVEGGVVYVPEDGGKESYENSRIYNESKKIVPVKYIVSSGEFSLSIPIQNAGAQFKVYSLDWTDGSSVLTNMEVAEVAPNMPLLQEIYAVDDHVFGMIPDAGKGPYTVQVTDGTNTYTGKADASGRFAVKVGDLPEGLKLTVSAIDTVNGKQRTSAKASVTVTSYKSALPKQTNITFNEIDSKGTLISGHIKGYTGKINLLVGQKRVTATVDGNGDFSYMLSKPRAVGTTIVALARNTDGSVYDICETTVKLAIPDMPELIDDVIYDTTTEVSVLCADKATAVVKVGSTYYKVTKCAYDKARGGYVYTVKFKKEPKKGAKVIVYMMNESGKSTKIQTVVKADPKKNG